VWCVQQCSKEADTETKMETAEKDDEAKAKEVMSLCVCVSE